MENFHHYTHDLLLQEYCAGKGLNILLQLNLFYYFTVGKVLFPVLRVYFGVNTCEVFLCFFTIICLVSVVFSPLFSLFYVVRERNRFYTEDVPNLFHSVTTKGGISKSLFVGCNKTLYAR